MSSNKVRVTYFIKDKNEDNGLSEVESTITRAWTGMGYESLSLTAKRCMPGLNAEWLTIVEDGGSAITFRVSNLESIEYEVIED